MWRTSTWPTSGALGLLYEKKNIVIKCIDTVQRGRKKKIIRGYTICSQISVLKKDLQSNQSTDEEGEKT